MTKDKKISSQRALVILELHNADLLFNTLPKGYNNALEKAKEVLKRDVPNDVIYEGDGYADGYMVYDMARCPNCDYLFDEDDGKWMSGFCPTCGQRLKW